MFIINLFYCSTILTDNTLNEIERESRCSKNSHSFTLVVDVCYQAPGHGQEGVQLLPSSLHQYEVHWNHTVLYQNEGGVQDRVQIYRFSK